MAENAWRPDSYPKTDCPHHPDSLWEWDGFGWICSPCAAGIEE